MKNCCFINNTAVTMKMKNVLLLETTITENMCGNGQSHTVNSCSCVFPVERSYSCASRRQFLVKITRQGFTC